MNTNKVYTPNHAQDLLDIIWERQNYLGLTDYELAKLSSVSRSAISRWKADQRSPQLVQIVPLLQALGLEVKIIEKD